MNNIEKLQALFKEFGIDFKRERESEIESLTIECSKGYPGFYTTFLFRKSGKFLEYGVWER